MGKLNEEQVKFLQVAEDRADDLNTMVDDMLDVSKLETGLLHVCRKQQTVRGIVDRVLPSLSRKATVKNLELNIDVPDGLPTVSCDDKKIARVIISLAVNALKFTAPNRTVTIWAQLDASDIRVGITDQGPGIAEDCLQSIFERLRQTDVAAMSSTEGFGLGLNIAKESVTLNLGKIDVESKTGEGSAFSFTIPIYDPGEICERYGKTLARRLDSVALIAARSQATDEEEIAAVNTFLSHVVRSNDLCFRTSDNGWLILLPEPELEAQSFITRATSERESVNRNRPKGPLPPIEYKLEHAWSNLRIRREEVVARVQSLVGERELCHA